jgi:hypothetical protein
LQRGVGPGVRRAQTALPGGAHGGVTQRGRVQAVGGAEALDDGGREAGALVGGFQLAGWGWAISV